MATAVAVMAIYILVLLAPLHQAAGLQRDLSALGYATLDGWSICSSIAPQNEDGKPPVVVKCAAAGIGKNELVGIQPAAIEAGILRTATSVWYDRAYLAPVVHSGWSLGRARAPPTA